MTHKQFRLLYDSLAVAVGTLYFLLVMLMFLARTLSTPSAGQPNGPVGTFVVCGLLGVASAVGGAYLSANGATEARPFGKAILIEGILLAVFTLIGWALVGPS